LWWWERKPRGRGRRTRMCGSESLAVSSLCCVCYGWRWGRNERVIKDKLTAGDAARCMWARLPPNSDEPPQLKTENWGFWGMQWGNGQDTLWPTTGMFLEEAKAHIISHANMLYVSRSSKKLRESEIWSRCLCSLSVEFGFVEKKSLLLLTHLNSN
jgi:hypothetical protein